MTIRLEKERLSQADNLAHSQREMRPTDFVTVYRSEYWKPRDSHCYISCSLVPCNRLAQLLSSSSPNLKSGEGLPGTVEFHEDGKQHVKYLRFGNEDGIEPLLIHRGFHGIREDYVEISEEFRHFHRLYHDRDSDEYFKSDDSGDEELVAVVKPHQVKVRLKEIRQFLAIKEMYLAIQFQYMEWSSRSLSELDLEEGPAVRERKGLSRWHLSYGDAMSLDSARQTFSVLRVLRLVEPLAKANSGFPGFADNPEKRYADFIIGVDENGDEIEHTCDPNSLANFFGSNPSAPNYLTPVDFRKDVLANYYNRTSRYQVSESALQCGYLWYIDIDNDHEDKVTVWLGDLGERLPYKEQLHWRAHNFVSGTTVSATFFSRQLLVKSAESGRPEHVFLQRYHELARASEEHLGWPLLRPLGEGDQHHLRSIRVPATDEQRDFDELVLGLAKILIDSQNDRELKNLLLPAQRESLKREKSISKLDAVFSSLGIDDHMEHTQFLKDLQALRSAGSAHSKGRKYHKILAKFSVDSQDLRIVFAGILKDAVAFLDFLIEVVQSEKLTQS